MYVVFDNANYLKLMPFMVFSIIISEGSRHIFRNPNTLILCLRPSDISTPAER